MVSSRIPNAFSCVADRRRSNITPRNHPEIIERRNLLTAGLAGAVAFGLVSCRGEPKSDRPDEAKGGEPEVGVSAVEDLMREHGVLRRILIAYAETARRLARNPGQVDAGALADAANLFRQFGEDYHERSLEERYIFSEIRRAGGEAGGLVDTLVTQHQRGREVTDFILDAVRGGSIGTANAEPLGRALLAVNRMYEAHTAWEDTIVFPAWKKAVAPARLAELAEVFEELEHKQFGEDGFDQAVRRVGSIEQRLGLTDLGAFTASPPPAV